MLPKVSSSMSGKSEVSKEQNVFNKYEIFFFGDEKRKLIQRGFIALAHLNPNSIEWDYQSCLGLSIWAQHFKVKRHNSNHNSRTHTGNGSRDSYHKAATLRWFNKHEHDAEANSMIY